MSSAASASQDSRARVLTAVASSPDPVSVEALAETTGLHTNTVRSHLEVLLVGGSIERESARGGGRGRPRWLYRRSEGRSSPFEFLAEALAVHLTRSKDPAKADGVAERWASALPDSHAATSPDAAVTAAADALSRLGFTADVSPVGDAIAITGCPYAALVGGTPVICDIHTALLARILRDSGQPVGVESMEVWARPGMCVARLRRPDLEPARRISRRRHPAVRDERG